MCARKRLFHCCIFVVDCVCLWCTHRRRSLRSGMPHHAVAQLAPRQAQSGGHGALPVAARAPHFAAAVAAQRAKPKGVPRPGQRCARAHTPCGVPPVTQGSPGRGGISPREGAHILQHAEVRYEHATFGVIAMLQDSRDPMFTVFFIYFIQGLQAL